MGLGGQARDGRRRRVLLDETLAGERPAARGAKTGRRRRSYADAALNDLQPRVSDLVPTRAPTLTLLFGTLLTVIAAIVTLHIHRDLLGTKPLAAANSPLALNAPGSLADWASSSMFLVGAFVAMQIFSVRRHRLDDYRGSYRVWLWIAPVLLWLSIDSATHLREPAAEAIARLPWFAKGGDTSWWWVAGYAAFFSMVTIRLVIETRRCRGAWSCWLAAIVLYAVGLAGQPRERDVESPARKPAPIATAPALPSNRKTLEATREALPIVDREMAGRGQRTWIELPDPELQTLLSRLPPLLGHWLALLGLSLYARHVRLDASGAFLPRKKQKDKKVEEDASDKLDSPAAEAASKDGRIVRADGPHAGPNKPHAGIASAPAKPSGPLAGRGSPSNNEDDDEDDDDDDSKLSRAERRRMKRAGR